MPYYQRPAKFSKPSIPPYPDPIQINQFGGIDLSADPTQIADNRSPEMYNYQLDTKGKLQRFFGYTQLCDTEDATHNIRMISRNPVSDEWVIACYDKLYTFVDGENHCDELYSGISNTGKIRCFIMNDKQFFMDGTHYLYYDGVNSVANVSSIAYVPTLTLGRPPSGGGTFHEDFNLLGAGFKDSFTADGTSDVYQLSLTGLDVTAPTVVVDGVTISADDYTFNNTNGTITFDLAAIPSHGNPDNVVITAYKSVSGYPEIISESQFFVLFGGENDTRVFVSGNPDFPNRDYASGLYDPTYFPENGYNEIGSDSNPIMGYAKQYRTCLIIKADNIQDSTIYLRTFSLDSNGNGLFSVEQGNSSVGCIATDSIQVIDNTPVFLSKSGVYRVNGTNVKDERIVEKISEFVDPELLQETLANAISFDFDGKYGLSFGDTTYVFDYQNKYSDTDAVKYETYLWSGFTPTVWSVDESTLYMGGVGIVYTMCNKDNASYNAAGVALPCLWKSKVFSMNADNYKKYVEKLHLTLTPESSKNKVVISYETDEGYEGSIRTCFLKTFDFGHIDFGNFTFNTSRLPQVFSEIIKAKKITFFQLVLTCDDDESASSVANIIVKFMYQNENR